MTTTYYFEVDLFIFIFSIFLIRHIGIQKNNNVSLSSQLPLFILLKSQIYKRQNFT